MTTDQQLEWTSTVLLAIYDDAVPDIPNQQRSMEATLNENNKKPTTKSEEVAARRSEKAKQQKKSEPSSKKDTKKISTKTAAEAYGKKNLAPIYGKLWRSHPDNVILKRHLKNKDFGAYQRIVDKRVQKSEKEVKNIQAVVGNKIKAVNVYQPDLFEKGLRESRARSKERFETLFRKLLGQKGYDDIKNRVLFYDTYDDMWHAGWKGKELEQAAAFVVPGSIGTEKMVFILDKIPEGDELQIFLHEVGAHVGLEGILSPEGVKTLAANIEKLYQEDLAKYGNEDFYMDDLATALQREELIGGNMGDSQAHFMARYAVRRAIDPSYNDDTGTVPDDVRESETIAFYVQVGIALGADPSQETSAGRLFRKFLDAAKRFFGIAKDNTDFNMGAVEISNFAWGAARSRLKGGNYYGKIISQLDAIQNPIKNKFKMVIKDWANEIESAVRSNYPKNDKGKYVPYDGSFVKDWSKYQKEQYLEEKGFRVQAEAQAESLIKQAEEHEKTMYDPDGKGYKRSFKFNRPPLNKEEKTRSKEEIKQIEQNIKETYGETVFDQWMSMGDVASKAINSTKFLHELAYEYRDELASGMTWLEVMNLAETMRNNLKQKVDSIAVQARDLNKSRLGVVNQMIAFGTQEQVWPADPKVAGKKVVVDKKFAKVFTEVLSKEEQKLVMDVYRHGEDMMLMKKNIAKELGVDDDFFGFSSLEGPYAPLRRTGTHTITLKSQTYLNAEKLLLDDTTSSKKKKVLLERLNELKTDPKHYEYRYFLSKGEAQKYMRQAKSMSKWAEGVYKPRAKGVGEGREPDKKVFDKIFGALSTSDLDSNSKVYVEDMLKKLYTESLEDTNARQGEGKRIGRGVPGFDSNMLRSFVNNAKSEANLLANMRYGKEINVNLSNARKEASESDDPELMNIYNMLAGHYNLMLNSKDTSIFNSVASFTTAMVLTTSVGYHLQNATQPWAVSYPILAADFNNWNGVLPKMTEGYRIAHDLISYDGKVPFIQWSKKATWQTDVNIEQVPSWVDAKKDPKERERRLKLWNETIKPLLVAMQGSNLLDLGIEQDLSDNVNIKNTGFKAWDAASASGAKVSHRLYQVPRMVEAYNRIATAIAAVEMAQENPKVMDTLKTNPTEYAVRIVRRTQGDFTAGGAPMAIKWVINKIPAGKLMVQFKKFGMMMAWNYVTSFKQAFLGKEVSKEERAMGRRALSYLLAHTVVLSGIRGLPFISYMTLLTFMLMGDEDEPDDTEGVIERKLLEMFPENPELAKSISRGPMHVLGVDTHSKLSQANIFSIMPFTDFGLDSESVLEMGFGLFGAAGANALNMSRGFEFLQEGNYYRGIESMVPKGVRSMLESWRLGTEGYSLRNGQVVAKPDSFSKFQLLLNSLGIPASDIVDLKWNRSEQFQITEYYTKKQAQMRKDYKKAYKKGDKGAMKKLIAQWMALQAGKDRVRPFFNDAPSAIRRTPITSLTYSPGREAESAERYRQQLGTN